MKTLEEFKKVWEVSGSPVTASPVYDKVSLEKIFKTRVQKQTNRAMQFFWASFVLQLIVYGLLSNVIIRHYSNTEVVTLAVVIVILYLPFTFLLMTTFKSLATTKLNGNTDTSLHHYALQQHKLLLSFYRFKKRYEFAMIPLSCAIGTILFFKLYIPGGVYEHLTGASITFIVSLTACALAIRSENKKNFDVPIRQLQEILEEFKNESKT